MSGGVFYFVNTSSSSLLPPLLKWAGIRKNSDNVDKSCFELCWGDVHKKKLNVNTQFVPVKYISETRLGSSEFIKIRGLYRTHMCVTFLLTECGASLMEKMCGSFCGQLLFCARKTEELLDLHLTVKFLLESFAAKETVLDLPMLPAICECEEYNSSLEWIANQKALDEERQDAVRTQPPRRPSCLKFTKKRKNSPRRSQDGHGLDGPCRCCTPLM